MSDNGGRIHEGGEVCLHLYTTLIKILISVLTKLFEKFGTSFLFTDKEGGFRDSKSAPYKSWGIFSNIMCSYIWFIRWILQSITYLSFTLRICELNLGISSKLKTKIYEILVSNSFRIIIIWPQHTLNNSMWSV